MTVAQQTSLAMPLAPTDYGRVYMALPVKPRTCRELMELHLVLKIYIFYTSLDLVVMSMLTCMIPHFAPLLLFAV